MVWNQVAELIFTVCVTCSKFSISSDLRPLISEMELTGLFREVHLMSECLQGAWNTPGPPEALSHPVRHSDGAQV